MWFLKILRMMFVTLDNAVYQCVDWLYQLFMMLAETGIFSSTDIRNFADRMYFFLGLIMIFKVSISIIQYIMNPDSVKDNKIGAPALLKNIVIILVGIVMIPYVFEAAYSLQRIVLKDNVIGSLILGMNYSSDDESKDMVQNAGNRMAFSTYTAFFHFDTAYISDECSNNPIKQDEKGNYLGEMSDACANDANRQGIDEFFNSNGADSFKKAYETLNMHKLYNDSIYNYTIKDENGEEQFLFSYLIVITTLAGGFLAYILLLFCFDIAVRSVKLGFLQLIAPIPLIAKIDPKKGDEVFNKWVKECISTYLSLFIRLVSIYFAIFIISLIGNGMFNVVDKSDVTNPFVFVFIIFGTLLFVKDLPKLIETITGMKLGDGKGSLNLAKKLGSVPLAGNMMGNTARKLSGGIDARRNGNSFKSGWKKAGQNDKGLFADLKKWDSGMRPYSADRRKKKFEGTEELGYLNRNWKRGDSVGTDLNKKNLDFSKFDGSSIVPYQEVYHNKQFQNSLKNLDAADTNYKEWEKKYQIESSSGHLSEDTQKNYVKAGKVLEGAKTVHESMRKRYASDARIQDAIKARKNNEFNPVHPSEEGKYTPLSDNTSSTTNTSSASNHDGTPTVGGVTVSNPQPTPTPQPNTPSTPKVNPGERTTSSGIILPSSVKIDNDKK